MDNKIYGKLYKWIYELLSNFNNSFKEYSQKIIREYKKNVTIGHINFIVIGKAG